MKRGSISSIVLMPLVPTCESPLVSDLEQDRMVQTRSDDASMRRPVRYGCARGVHPPTLLRVRIRTLPRLPGPLVEPLPAPQTTHPTSFRSKPAKVSEPEITLLPPDDFPSGLEALGRG